MAAMMISAKTTEAMASIVWYPSRNPLPNALGSVLPVISPRGKKTPFKMIRARVIRRNGVSIFPILSTTFFRLRAKNSVMAK